MFNKIPSGAGIAAKLQSFKRFFQYLQLAADTVEFVASKLDTIHNPPADISSVPAASETPNHTEDVS